MGIELLIDAHGRATEDQRERGRLWYPRMREACKDIAHDTRVPLDQVAAVVAVTSPDAQLAANLRWAREACATRGAALVGRYPNSMAKRYRPILAREVTPEAGVGGPKVTAFYHAIMGGLDAVVLDRWALRAVGHHRDTATPKQYSRLAGIYADVAEHLDEHPRDLQAIVWIVTREGTLRADGRSRGLQDIHQLGRTA